MEIIKASIEFGNISERFQKLSVYVYHKSIPAGTLYMLQTNKSNKNPMSATCRLCNGLGFVETKTGFIEFLTVLPPAMETRVDKSDIVENIDNFTVYPIIDGTLISLYNTLIIPSGSFGNWHMNSAHSITLEGIKPNGYDKTYGEFFLEICNEKFPDNPMGIFEVLDPKKIYTFIMQHSSLNPFSRKKKIIFVCTVDKNFSDIEAPEFENIYPKQKSIEVPDMSILDSHNDDTIRVFATTGKKNLGYIFKSPEITYIVRSKLFNTIRKNIYGPHIDRLMNSTRTAASMSIKYDKLMAIALREYIFKRLHSGNDSIFPIIFIRLKKTYNEIVDHFTAALNHIHVASFDNSIELTKFESDIKPYTLQFANGTTLSQNPDFFVHIYMAYSNFICE